MRTPNIPVWLGGAALFCLIAWCSAPARAQSMDSQQMSGAESGASPSAQVNAQVSGGMSGGGGSGSASFSASGGGSAAPSSPRSLSLRTHSSRGLNTLARGAGALTRASGSVVDRGKVKGMPSASRPSVRHGYRTARAAHVPASREAAMASAWLKSSLASTTPGAIRGASTEVVSYSDGFADSTKGTALISPPDRGTSGPFAFKPNLNFKLPGFSERPFLSPALHVGGGVRGKRNAGNRTSASVAGQSRRPVFNSISDSLGLNVLKDDLGSGITSNPASDLGTDIDASTNQQ